MTIKHRVAAYALPSDGLGTVHNADTRVEVFGADGTILLAGRTTEVEELARRGWWIPVNQLDAGAYTIATGAVGVAVHADGLTLSVDDTTPIIEIDFDLYGPPHFIPCMFAINVAFVSAATLIADQRIEVQVYDTGNGDTYFWNCSHAWDGAAYEVRAGKVVAGTPTETVSNYAQRADAFLGMAIHTRDTTQGDVRANYGTFDTMSGSPGYSIGLNSASGVVSGTMASKLFKCRVLLHQGGATGVCVYRLKKIFFQPTVGLDNF